MATDLNEVIFLEFPGEVDAFLAQVSSRDGLSSKSTVIALNPATLAHLKRQGYPAENTLPYLGPASRKRALDRSSHISQWMRERFDYVDSWGVRAGYVENLVWYTRWLTNYLLWALEILDSAVARHGARALSACVAKSPDASGPMTGYRERYFGTMAESFAAVRGLKFRPIPIRVGSSPRERAGALVHRIGTTLAPNPLVTRLHLLQLRRYTGKGPVLFTNSDYRMGALAGRIRQEQGALPILFSDWGSRRTLGWPITSKVMAPFAAEARLSLLETAADEDKESRRRLREAVDRFENGVSLATDVFSHLGITFAEVVARKIRRGIRPVILGLHRRAAALKLLLDDLQPSLVFSNGCRIDDMIVGELCRAANIPSMMITHGSHTPPSGEAERYEWGEHGRRLINAPYRFTALQSPVAEEFRKVFPSDSEGTRTGPVIWATSDDRERSDGLRRRMMGDVDEDRIIVHAGTPKAEREGMRFHVYETLDEYVQGIRDLVAAVERVEGTRLIVKFRPMPQLGLEDLNTLVDFFGEVHGQRE